MKKLGSEWNIEGLAQAGKARRAPNDPRSCADRACQQLKTMVPALHMRHASPAKQYPMIERDVHPRGGFLRSA
jgi:hypothetical protein